MAERKLNLNAPLMSVRRFASPKRESPRAAVAHHHHHQSSPTNLCLEQVTEPVAVPFHWEKIPGRAKHESPATREKSGAEEEEEEDSYSDAVESLSSRESVSLNCSASGLSGSDGAGLPQPSGSFSKDPQTRDFMMNRFLPAAKAMALEPPRSYSNKKPQPQQPPPTRLLVKKPHFGETQRQEKEEESEEDDDDDEEAHQDFVNEPKIISTKGCGLFPKLCLRNSLSLLGPLAGLKVTSPSPRSAINQSLTKTVKKAWENYKKKSEEVKKVEETKKKAEEPKRLSFSGELKGRLSPFRSSRSRSGELGMVQSQGRGGESKRFTYSGELYRGRLSPFRNTQPTPEIVVAKKKNLKTETPELRRLAYSGELHRNPRAASISPYRNQSFQRGGTFLGVPKADYSEANNYTNRPNLFITRGAVEKTVYVDTVGNKSNALALEILEQELAMADQKEYANPRRTAQSPVPPPLPRSPSESWLWRTVPSSQKVDTKWETIVKTTNLRNDHARYSQELVAHVSKQTKT